MKLNNKIGCFSDIHLGIGQDSTEWHEIAINFAKWASEKYKDRGVEDIIIPGDIFHNRSHISVETLSVAKSFFDYFKDFNIIISTGNHDCYKKDSSDVNSISILDGWNNIQVIEDSPKTIHTVKGKTITLIPWGSSVKDIENCDIIFGHFEINSFYMNSYKLCEHGITYKELLNKAPMVISGHFHKRDHRNYEKGDIVYLGSPYQHNFGDIKDDRGIYILDTDDNKMEFIENNISPKHYKVKINEKIEEEFIKNNFISLEIDNNEDSDKIIEFKAQINKLNPKTIRLNYNESNSDIQIEKDEKEIETSDVMKSIEEYIDILNPENKKEVAEYIKEIYNNLI
jgi:DNA repair exonuclease SbcCD nuclease subunit